jgi:hypothetical protein
LALVIKKPATFKAAGSKQFSKNSPGFHGKLYFLTLLGFVQRKFAGTTTSTVVVVVLPPASVASSVMV